MVIRIKLDELEEKFREVAMRKYGYGKGALLKAGKEAIEKWIREQEVFVQKKLDPVEELRGLIKVKGVSSVNLRHEITKLWVRKGFE